MNKKNLSMKVVNQDAVGIDVGSRSHFVAIGQEQSDVYEFGLYNQDLHNLTQLLLSKKIKTVAMESTGRYWQNLYSILRSAGLEVILCNGKFTKNVKGRKTDVQDCQWIQKQNAPALLNTFERKKRKCVLNAKNNKFVSTLRTRIIHGTFCYDQFELYP